MATMQLNDPAAQKELKRLRSLSGNSRCADCDRQDNSWSSVSHGVFICVTCSDVHRSVGTHITKVKGCTGTYLWGPDELDRMQSVGNRGGDDIYGAEKVDPGASKEKKQRFVVEKYEKRSFAGRTAKGARGQAQADPVLAQVKDDSEKVNLERQGPVVRTGRNMAEAAITQPSQNLAPAKAGLAPVGRQASVPDSLFDELFGDFNESQDSYFGNSSEPLKSFQIHSTPLAAAADSRTDSNLDAFLNTTLHGTADRGVSLKTTQTDPFADWLDFEF